MNYTDRKKLNIVPYHSACAIIANNFGSKKDNLYTLFPTKYFDDATLCLLTMETIYNIEKQPTEESMSLRIQCNVQILSANMPFQIHLVH